MSAVALSISPLFASKERPKIGLSLDTLKEERWQRDRDTFVTRATAPGAEVIVQSANSDDSRQVRDIEALITRGVDVLVVVPHNGAAMTRAVKAANEAKIPVICYDRLILNSDVETLLGILRRLRAQGTACIYISHKLDEVFAFAVLRDGATVASFAARDANVPAVIRHMVGREITELFPRKPPAAPGDVQLRVRDLAVAPGKGAPAFLEGISFELRRGEVLGFGGSMSAGRTELLMHLFGAWGHRLGGTVELGGASHAKPTPRSSIARGMVLVCEDRRRHGLVIAQPIGFNLSLSSLSRFTRFGKISGPPEFVRNQELFSQLSVKAPGLHSIVGGLSGGNQQKVVIGKALMTGPSVVMLERDLGRAVPQPAPLRERQARAEVPRDAESLVHDFLAASPFA